MTSDDFYEDLFRYPQLDFAFYYHYEHKLPFVSDESSVLEFGTGGGSSTKKICDLLKYYTIDRSPVFTIDSFQGLPKEKDGMELFSKFKEGSYKFDISDEEIKKKCDYDYLTIYRTKFDQLSNQLNVRIPFIIHIDCDLYQSTYDALDWCFRNNLVEPGCLIAFDEFWSTDTTGGEGQAFGDICDKYNVEFESVFYYCYLDKDTKQKITQEVYKITSINNE